MKTIALALLLALAGIAPARAAQPEEPKTLVIFYSLTGTTRWISEMIQDRTGADIHEIETVKTYPTRLPGLYDEPKRELEENDFPELKGEAPDLARYDLILVGGPVWWYCVATPLIQFLKSADFAGKKVAPFATYGTTLGDYFTDFRNRARNAVVLDGLDLSKPRAMRAEELDRRLDEWLDAVGKQ